MENSRPIEHSDFETRAANSQGLSRKGSYLVCLIIAFVAVYSQYLGVHFGLILGASIVYGIPVLAITLLWGTTIIRRFFNNTASALRFGFASFGAFTVLGIVLAIVISFFLILFNPSTVNLLNRPNPVLNVSPEFARIMVGVSLLVVGPAEEYIFRGFMFGGLLDIFKNRHWLILAFVSSLLFAAVHLYYSFVYEAASLILFTDLVTFGMSMAVTYYLSGGNLFVPALIHGVYDATAFVGVATSMNVGSFLRAFLILFSIIIAIVVFIQTRSKRDKGFWDKTLPPNPNPKTLNRRNPEYDCGNPMKNPDLCSTRDLCEHRRGRHDIIMSILTAAQKGEMITNIIQKANLSTTQAEAYLTELESRNLLSKHIMPGRNSFVWKTTSKGLTVIDACQKCARLADKPT